MTGGAPTPPTTMAFLHECYGTANIDVFESFGTTETGSITVDGYVDSEVTVYLRPLVGVSLEANPSDRNTTTADVGEILVKKAVNEMSKGYFHNSTETNSHFADGYYATGDIGRRLPNGQIQIIDRIKNVFKLAQGEFVAPQKIEEVLLLCPQVYQVFVTGNITERQVVAIVVLASSVDTGAGSGTGADGTAGANGAGTTSLPVVTPSMLLHSFQKLGASHGLASYEIPVAVHIDEVPWVSGSGILTSSGKMQRQQLNHHYAAAIEQLYTQTSFKTVAVVGRILAYLCCEKHSQGNKKEAYVNVENNNADCVDSDSKGVLTVKEKDCREGEWIGDEVIGYLLPDSLSMVQLSHRLRDDLHFSVPFATLLHSSTTLLSLRELFASPKGSSVNLCDESHTEAFWLQESQLALESEAKSTAGVECGGAGGDTALLTGATGFLGPYLLHTLAQRYKRVICLVRAADDSLALARVQALLLERSLPLPCSLETTKGRDFAVEVEVWAGDFEQTHFGLSASQVHRLETEVSDIYHNGAKVSAVLPYTHLRTANVESTKYLIRLASRGVRKRLHFMSSTSAMVAPTAAEVGSKSWRGGAESMSTPADRVSELSGYGQSKWVR